MFGILIVICILAVMGFVLAWITGVVANEEMSVGRAMGVVFLNGIATGAAGYFVGGMGLPNLANTAILAVLSVCIMSLLLRALGGIDFKKGLVIAVVFGVITSFAQWGLASCMYSAAQSYTPPAR